MDGPVTRLTRHGIKTIHDEAGKKTRAVVQYLSRSQQTLKDKVLYSVHLSDGSFLANFLLYPTINDAFLSQVQPLDILEVGALKKDQNSPFMLIYEFTIVYSGVRETVGSPVEYRPGVENPRGHERLPAHLIDSPLPPVEEAAPIARMPQPAVIDTDTVPNSILYTEIANLNMYDRSWNIRGRVVRKSEMKRFRNSSREGCVFNVVIRDETRAIQASLFNEVAEKYFHLLREGRVFGFSDGEVRSASRFNTTDNRYEICFNERSVIREIPNDTSIPTQSFKIVTIEEVQRKNETDVFDVLGVVVDTGVSREVTLKDGSARERRTVTLADQSGYQIEATLWGQSARDFSAEVDGVVLLQDVRVREYNGKTLTTSANSRVLTRVPDCPELKALVLFRNSRQRGTIAVSLTDAPPTRHLRVHKIGQLERECDTLLEDAENTRLYFTVIAHSLRAVNNLYYDSCPNDNCMKKLSPNTNNTFYCEKCQKTFDAAKPRFMATLKVADDSGSMMLTCAGDELCQVLLGCSSERLKELRDDSEVALAEFVREKLFGEYRIRVGAKKDTYNGETRVRFSAGKVTPLAGALDSASEAFYQFLTQ